MSTAKSTDCCCYVARLCKVQNKTVRWIDGAGKVIHPSMQLLLWFTEGGRGSSWGAEFSKHLSPLSFPLVARLNFSVYLFSTICAQTTRRNQSTDLFQRHPHGLLCIPIVVLCLAIGMRALCTCHYTKLRSQLCNPHSETKTSVMIWCAFRRIASSRVFSHCP